MLRNLGAVFGKTCRTSSPHCASGWSYSALRAIKIQRFSRSVAGLKTSELEHSSPGSGSVPASAGGLAREVTKVISVKPEVASLAAPSVELPADCVSSEYYPQDDFAQTVGSDVGWPDLLAPPLPPGDRTAEASPSVPGTEGALSAGRTDSLAAAPAPPVPLESLTLAPLVQASDSLRRLVALGVDTSGWDKRGGVAQYVVKLDFERDMSAHLLWLCTEAGVSAEKLGQFLTQNPFIFKEDLHDLQVRLNYLSAKNFSPDQIVSVVSRNPFWLMLNTARVDRRLGFFSGMFYLTATELRQLAARCPKLITSNLTHVKESRFTIKEEFGFTTSEMKSILLNKPRVWMLSRSALQERLHFLHNSMGLSHKLIAANPNVITYRAWRVRQRHLMLSLLGRNQYDSRLAGFVSLDRLVGNTDEQFCKDVAKVPLATYHEFLKTL